MEKIRLKTFKLIVAIGMVWIGIGCSEKEHPKYLQPKISDTTKIIEWNKIDSFIENTYDDDCIKVVRIKTSKLRKEPLHVKTPCPTIYCGGRYVTSILINKDNRILIEGEEVSISETKKALNNSYIEIQNHGRRAFPIYFEWDSLTSPDSIDAIFDSVLSFRQELFDTYAKTKFNKTVWELNDSIQDEIIKKFRVQFWYEKSIPPPPLPPEIEDYHYPEEEIIEE